MAEDAMRLDRFLWFARLVKTRPLAQELAAAGRLRLDGRVIERASASVRVGNILTFGLRGEVRVLRVEALPRRRGPAPEARACYSELTAGEGG
jgi:ribosome-associated heat shock protein Hsp15